MKPGYRTTEFWLTLAANILGSFLASGVIETDSQAMRICGVAAMILTSMGYSVSRGMAKGSTPPASGPAPGDRQPAGEVKP